MRRFSLDPPEHAVPGASVYRDRWVNVRDLAVRSVISVEHQYLDFHRYLLSGLRHTSAEFPADPIPIGLSVRAGAIKTTLFLGASIAEAALRAHAERRGYQLPPNRKHRTMGKVLEAWCTAPDVPQPELAPIWNDLRELHDIRNNVHLYKAVQDGTSFYDFLDSEAHALTRIDVVLRHIQQIVSP